jgi:flagellar biogenesis protein FliO
MRLISILFVLLLAFSTAVCAEEGSVTDPAIEKLRRMKANAVSAELSTVQPSEEHANTEAESSGFVGKAFQGLSLCLGVFLVLVYFMKRGQPGRGSEKKQRLTIREQLSIAPKASVTLLSVDGREVLVGVTESSVTVLKEFPEKRAVQKTNPPVSLQPAQVISCGNE